MLLFLFLLKVVEKIKFLHFYYFFCNKVKYTGSTKLRGPGRPPKKIIACTWCNEGKLPLKYILPTAHGKKEFCSETCLAEFRKAYVKGACLQCDNVIRGNSNPSKDYCSIYCMNKHQKKSNEVHGRVLAGKRQYKRK